MASKASRAGRSSALARREDARLPGIAADRRLGLHARGQGRQEPALVDRPARSRRPARPPRGRRPWRFPERTPPATRARRRPVRRGWPSRARSAGSPFSASTRPATSTPGIWTSSARWAKAGRNSRRLGGHVRVRVEERVAERRLVARRDLALDLTAGGRGGELVELVEQARDRVRAFRHRTRSPGSAGDAGT